MAKFILSAELQLRGVTNVRPLLQQLRAQLNGFKGNININANIKNLAALNSQFGTLTKNITVSTKQTQQLNSAVKDTTASSIKLGKTFSDNVKRYSTFTLVTTSLISLGIALKSGVKQAFEFQHGLVRISQITGVSVKNLSGLTREITKLSTELGVSASELLEVSETLAQAGIPLRDVKIALEALAKTKLAPTFGDIKDTVEGAIASMKQFDIETSELKATLGSFNTVAAGFAIEADDIVQGVRRAGATFKSAGGTLNEFIALMTAVRQTTRESAETIATGFRTIFARLQRPQTLVFLKELGVDLQNAEGQFIGPIQAVRKLNAALADIPSTDVRFARIVEEIGGIRQLSKVIPLLQQMGVAEKALSVARRGTTSLDRDAATAQQSLLVQLTRLREEFFALFRTVADNQAIKDFIQVALALAGSLIKITEALSGLIPLFISLGTIKLGGGLAGFSSGIIGGRKKFASGGVVPGSGNSDNVSALLTPGEFVVDKKTAQSVGYANLEGLKKARKYAKGGVVRKYATGGKVAGATSIGASATLLLLPQILGQFSQFSDELKSVSTSLVAFGVAAAITGKSVFSLKDSNEKIGKKQSLVTGAENRLNKAQDNLSLLEQGRTAAESQVTASKNEQNVASSRLNTIGQNTTNVLNNGSSTLFERKVALNQERLAFQRVKEAGKNVTESVNRLQDIDDEVVKTERKVDAIASRVTKRKATTSKAKFSRGLGVASAVGVIGGTGLSLAGGQFINGANANIERGTGSEKDVQRIGLGNKLSNVGGGAVTGGVLGAQVGGPLGALGGAVIGGLVGFLTSTNDEIEAAREKIKSVKFSASIDALAKDLSRVATGKTSTTLSGVRINTQLKEARGALFSGSTEDRTERKNLLTGQITGIEEVGNKLAGTVEDIDQFKSASGGLGQTVIDVIAQLTNVPVKEVEEGFANLIKSTKDATKVQQKINEAQKSIFNQNQFVNDLVNAFRQASDAAESFASVAATITSNFESISFNGQASNVIGRGLGAGKGLGGALQQTLGGIGGTGNLIKNLTDSSSAAQNLPNVLVNAAQSGDLTDDGILKSVERGLGTGFPEELKSIIINNVASMLGSEGGVEEFNKEVKNNAAKFAQELTKGAEDLFEPLREAAQIAESESKRIVELVQQRSKIEANITDFSVGIAKANIGINKQGAAIGNTEKFNKAGQLTSADLKVAKETEQGIRFRGFQDLNSTSTAASITQAGINRQSKLTGLQSRIDKASLFGGGGGEANPNALAGPNAAGDSLFDLAQEAANVSREYQEIIKVLNEQASSTERLTALQNELNTKEQERLNRNDTLTELQSREGRQNFAKGFKGAQVLASSPGAVGSEEQVTEAFAFLDKIKSFGAGDTQLAGLGGKSANQVKNENNAATLSKITGISFQDALEKVTAPPEEIKLQNEIINQQKLMVSAQEALRTLEENKLDLLNDNIVDGFATTQEVFKQALLDAEGRRAGQKLLETQVKSSEAKIPLEALDSLQSQGISLDKANVIKQNESLFKQFDANQSELSGNADIIANLPKVVASGTSDKSAFGRNIDEFFGNKPELAGADAEKLRVIFTDALKNLNSSTKEIDIETALKNIATRKDDQSAFGTDAGMSTGDIINSELKNIVLQRNQQIGREQEGVTNSIRGANLGAELTSDLLSDKGIRNDILGRASLVGGKSEAQSRNDAANASRAQAQASRDAQAISGQQSVTEAEINKRKAIKEGEIASRNASRDSQISSLNAQQSSSAANPTPDFDNIQRRKEIEQELAKFTPKNLQQSEQAAFDNARRRGSNPHIARNFEKFQNRSNKEQLERELNGLIPNLPATNRPAPNQGVQTPAQKAATEAIVNKSQGAEVKNPLVDAINIFRDTSLELAKALNQFPRIIEMNAKVEPLQVAFTGLEGLGGLQEGLSQYVQTIIDTRLKEKMPSLGPSIPKQKFENIA